LSVSASVADVVRLSSLPATTCADAGTVSLSVGEHRLKALASTTFSVTALALTDRAAHAIAAPVPVAVSAWAPESRSFSVPAGPETIVELGEGFNAGWTASVDGSTISPLRLDGWRQAWRVPASTTARTIEAVYTPGTTQRIALAVGALLLLVVVAAALVPGSSISAPVGAARARRGEVAALTLAVPALVASWAGLAVGAIALAVARRTSARARAGAAAVSLAISACVAAAFSAPWGSSPAAGAAQLLAVLAVALVGAAGVDDASAATGDPAQHAVLDEEPRQRGDGDAADQRE
jgi:arabinofuranan 3-O-arabinosyltransferase